MYLLQNSVMNNIEQIKDLLKKTKSIAELIVAIRQAEIPAVYVSEIDNSFKKHYGVAKNRKWHRFFVETSLTAVNKWENISNYSMLLINDDMQETKLIEKS